MKKFLALFLTLVLLAGLTACKAADAADPAQEQNTVTAPHQRRNVRLPAR